MTTNHVRTDDHEAVCGATAPETRDDLTVREARRRYGFDDLGRVLHCSACYDRVRA